MTSATNTATRYSLGPLEPDCLNRIELWRNAPEARAHLRNGGVRATRATIAQILESRDNWRMFGVFQKPEPDSTYSELVGYGGLTSIDWVNRCAELAILSPNPKVEVAGGELLLAYAFNTLGLHRVEAECYTTDRELLVEALGFTQEGTRRAALWRDGRWRDTTLWARVSRETHDGGV